METNEHKQIGDQIRIETLNNPYLKKAQAYLRTLRMISSSL